MFDGAKRSADAIAAAKAEAAGSTWRSDAPKREQSPMSLALTALFWLVLAGLNIAVQDDAVVRTLWIVLAVIWAFIGARAALRMRRERAIEP